jgi:hypothetical protein
MLTTFIDGILFKHQMKPGQLANALERITTSRIACNNLRDQLKAATILSSEEQALACHQFLTSAEVALEAVIGANKRLDKRYRATLDHCLSVASTLNLDCPITEPVVVRPRLKRSGGFRVTHRFGLRHRTAQEMFRRVLECHFAPHPSQLTFRGLHQAIVKAKILLQSGLSHFATLDIKDHFGSFELSELSSELPLPNEWVANAVVARHMAVVADKRAGVSPYTHIPTATLLERARQGIPAGSAGSPIVAAYSVSRLGWTSLPETALLNWSDNFLIQASTAKRLGTGMGALAAAVSKLPGGQFSLKTVQEGHAKRGFDFLGHRLHCDGARVRTEVSPANQADAIDEVNRLTQKLNDAHAQGHKEKAISHLKSLCAYVKGWVQVFRECDDIEEWERALLCMIQDNAAFLGVSVEELYPTVIGKFEYSAQEYANV